jgi:hypothetical protein
VGGPGWRLDRGSDEHRRPPGAVGAGRGGDISNGATVVGDRTAGGRPADRRGGGRPDRGAGAAGLRPEIRRDDAVTLRASGPASGPRG